MGTEILIRMRTKGSAGKEYICMEKGNEWCPPGQCPGANTPRGGVR